MRDDLERIRDVLEAIEKIKQYVDQGRDEFVTNELIQVWMLHHLQIIGEALYKISDDFQVMHPEINWKSVIGMRHILVHGYFEIDLAIVWDAIRNDLPILKNQVQAILE